MKTVDGILIDEFWGAKSDARKTYGQKRDVFYEKTHLFSNVIIAEITLQIDYKWLH